MDLTLATILTAGGAVAAAALVTGLIAMAKNLVGIGPLIDNKNEPTVAFILAAILVAIAAFDAGVHDLATAFLDFLAWFGIATIAMGIHDQVSPTKPTGG